MTTIHSGDIDCPIAPFLSISSARLRSLILKKHLTTLNAQLRTDKKADPHLTRMILLNMFQIFQITRINFDQYLHIHKHPDTYSTQKDATTQTEHTTIKPKRLVRLYPIECVPKWKNNVSILIGPQMTTMTLTKTFKKILQKHF